jgi:hypothetical protein
VRALFCLVKYCITEPAVARQDAPSPDAIPLSARAPQGKDE